MNYTTHNKRKLYSSDYNHINSNNNIKRRKILSIYDIIEQYEKIIYNKNITINNLMQKLKKYEHEKIRRTQMYQLYIS